MDKENLNANEMGSVTAYVNEYSKFPEFYTKYDYDELKDAFDYLTESNAENGVIESDKDKWQYVVEEVVDNRIAERIDLLVEHGEFSASYYTEPSDAVISLCNDLDYELKGNENKPLVVADISLYDELSGAKREVGNGLFEAGEDGNVKLVMQDVLHDMWDLGLNFDEKDLCEAFARNDGHEMEFWATPDGSVVSFQLVPNPWDFDEPSDYICDFPKDKTEMNETQLKIQEEYEKGHVYCVDVFKFSNDVNDISFETAGYGYGKEDARSCFVSDENKMLGVYDNVESFLNNHHKDLDIDKDRIPDILNKLEEQGLYTIDTKDNVLDDKVQEAGEAQKQVDGKEKEAIHLKEVFISDVCDYQNAYFYDKNADTIFEVSPSDVEEDNAYTIKEYTKDGIEIVDSEIECWGMEVIINELPENADILGLYGSIDFCIVDNFEKENELDEIVGNADGRVDSENKGLAEGKGKDDPEL